MTTAVFDDAPLTKHTTRFGQRIPSADTLPLSRVTTALHERFGRVSAPVPDAGRLDAAIRQAQQDATKLRSGQRLLLASALAQPTPALHGKCLFDCDAVLTPLLETWKHDVRNGTLRLSHWKGLFHSYMQIPAGAVQTRIGNLLRTSLDPALRTRRHTPAWVEGFRRHEQLLGDHPCAPYFEDLLQGRSDRLDDLREHAGVSIPDTSWFWQRLKEQVLVQIARLSKSAFLASIDRFVHMDTSGSLRGATDELIQALLERYLASGELAAQPVLMHFALDHWGSPQLDRNGRWHLCSTATRQMVCRWIAKEDLEQFYRLCKDEYAVDEARLEFWLQFQQQMAYTQILVGGAIQRSPEPSIREFVEARTRQGRLGKLVTSELANNALLLQIGHWVFIEFSKIGTACRCVRQADRELDLGQPDYTLDTLRHVGEKWVHRPGWQERFLQQLAKLGLMPDKGATLRTPTTTPKHTPKQTSRGDAQGPTIDPRALQALGLRVVDRRTIGGAIWVQTTATTKDTVLPQLVAMGFRYVKDKGAWYHS